MLSSQYRNIEGDSRIESAYLLLSDAMIRTWLRNVEPNQSTACMCRLLPSEGVGTRARASSVESKWNESMESVTRLTSQASCTASSSFSRRGPSRVTFPSSSFWNSMNAIGYTYFASESDPFREWLHVQARTLVTINSRHGIIPPSGFTLLSAAIAGYGWNPSLACQGAR